MNRAYWEPVARCLFDQGHRRWRDTPFISLAVAGSPPTLTIRLKLSSNLAGWSLGDINLVQPNDAAARRHFSCGEGRRPPVARISGAFPRILVSDYKGAKLLGANIIDEDAVPTGEIKLVEYGVLKTFFALAFPVRTVPTVLEAAAAGGQLPAIWLSHLRNLMSEEELRKELLRRAEDRGLDFGIVIRRVGGGLQHSGKWRSPWASRPLLQSPRVAALFSMGASLASDMPIVSCVVASMLFQEIVHKERGAISKSADFAFPLAKQ
jgi:hypothetical protein